ncbi:ABC transporter substrate-binding protein [Rhizobiaceae bacterium BDR2-2]|uniref:ABC transporter substrate-binding protein n=1 Tax=Ectorhizobium quercum TaxID=2965071 RepID=A0AAE3SWA5_9HYPH|nr:ABC transporter substrate-binding protein [Ectorhizobium quercum]MCX8997809.1 ABC transporter substrate-binding protein [Ectorhizobium quercum]
MFRFLFPTTCCFALAASTFAAQAEVLAVVAPETGPFARLGQQVFVGAQRLADEKQLDLVRIPESCEAGSGDAISAEIVSAGAVAAIGFLCGESFDGGGGRLKAAGIPAISVSVRSKILFEDVAKEDWPIFTLAPHFEDEAEKLTEIIAGDWQSVPFALIDDGTLPARELVEAVRNRLEERGLRPQFVDTFRPGMENQIALVRRLQNTGATHVLFGGDHNDAAVIMRDAASENIALRLLGGEALNAADQPVPLADGVQAVLPPQTPLAAQPVIDALGAEGIVAEGYVLPAYAAATIAAQAAEAAQRAGIPVASVVQEGRFETVLGPFAFGPEAPHRNPYLLMEWRDGAFVPVGETP